MLFKKETLKSFADSKGIMEIEDEAYRILSQDLEYRIKEVCQEAAKFMTASHRIKLNINDVNNALTSRNVEPLFGYDSQEILMFRGLPSKAFYAPDEEIDFDEYLELPLPKIPLRPYIQSHWLAIEGVQPPIQQNPIIVEKPTVKGDSLSHYKEEVTLKKQVKHRLTKELNMYFEKILQVMDSDPTVSMDCLSNETGIQQLVPYFIHHFNTEMRSDISNSPKVKTILLMYYSLLKNPSLFIDPYLHEILPSLLTGVTGKSVDMEVRLTACDVVKFVFDHHSFNYQTLGPRIIQTLKKTWLDDSKVEDSQYGALFCLSQLSSTVVSTHIIPNIQNYNSGHQKVMDLIKKIKFQ